MNYIKGEFDEMDLIPIKDEAICSLYGWHIENRKINGFNFTFYNEPKVNGIVFGSLPAEEEGQIYVHKNIVKTSAILREWKVI